MPVDVSAALTAARDPVGVNQCPGCSGCQFDVLGYFETQRTKVLMRPPMHLTQGKTRRLLAACEPEPRVTIEAGRNRLMTVRTATGEDVTNGYECGCGQVFKVREFGRTNARAMKGMCCT